MNQWGCANRPAKEGFWAQDGWLTTESGQPYQPKFVWGPYRMSQGCGYDKIDEDAKPAEAVQGDMLLPANAEVS